MEHLGTDNVDVGIPLCDIIVETPFKTATRVKTNSELSINTTLFISYSISSSSA